MVSAPNSKTYRMFKVIAVDHDGLFLADSNQTVPTRAAKPEKGKGGMGPMGRRGRVPP